MGRGSEHLGSHGVIYDIKIAHSRYGSRIHLLLERAVEVEPVRAVRAQQAPDLPSYRVPAYRLSRSEAAENMHTKVYRSIEYRIWVSCPSSEVAGRWRRPAGVAVRNDPITHSC